MNSIPEAFHQFYQEMWGDRWKDLFAALQAEPRQVQRANRFSKGESFDQRRDSAGLLNEYVMDPGSILAAKALRVQPGMEVLDLCAAPGGKTLILAEDLFLNEQGQPESVVGRLTANEPSQDRRVRLTKVIRQYIPQDIRQSVWVTGKEGSTLGKNPKPIYDRILVDAPCSGEKHILEDAAALADWSPRRSEGLMKRQYALLTAAFENLKPGGRIVYSTCSLSRFENEEVVRRFLKKRGELGQVVLDDLALEAKNWGLEKLVEPWEFGFQVLPDRGGAGPLRWCVLIKNEDAD